MGGRLKVFFDGGCRPMPDGIEIAVVLRGEAHVHRGLGSGTSMDAEWRALIEAARVAMPFGGENIVLLGDSAAVVGRINGVLRCSGADIAHLGAFREVIGHGAMPRVRHIRRAQNLAGIALARLHGR